MIRTSESVDKISAALVGAQAELPSAPKAVKGQVGNQIRFYADLATVVEAARPVLAKHELGYVQFPCGLVNGIVTVTTRIIHVSGEWMEADSDMPCGQGGAQAVGSGISYAKRYALMAALGMVTDDDDGAPASSAPKPAARRAQPPPPGPRLPNPGTYEERDPRPAGLATDKQIQRIQIMMNGKGDRDAKLTYLSGLVGRQLASSKELTQEEAGRVLDHLDAQ